MPSDLQTKYVNLLYGNGDRLDKVNYLISENGSTVSLHRVTYLAVAWAVQERRISVMSNVPPGLIAAYDNARDLLAVDFGMVRTDKDQSEVMHECTHALVDLMNAVNFTLLTSEVAAFLSQAIYLKGIGQPLPTDTNDLEYNQILAEADRLAQKMKLYDQNLVSAPVMLSRPDFQALRAAIQQHPLYPKFGPEERIHGIGVK